MSPEPRAEGATAGRVPRGAVLLALVLALGLGLRLANAAWGSLKLDDFHSLHHARAADATTFWRVLELDNHPPLSFVFVAASRAAFGESPWALRLPALLAGMGTLLLVWRLGARFGSPRVQATATLLVAASALHVECSSDVRMYGLLALASAGLLEALGARLEEGRGGARVVLWSLVGLHAHYHFLYLLAVLGGGALALTLWDARSRAAHLALAGGLALTGLLAAPWYFLGFPAQLGHGLAPGGSNATLARLLEGLKNLVFLNVSAGGALGRGLGLLASAAFLGLAAGALVRLAAGLRAPAPARPGATRLLAAATAVCVPLLTYLAARLSTRAGFEWRYFAGVVPAFCLLVASEIEAPGRFLGLRRAAVALVCVAALANAALNARDPGEEDYRDAVAWILDQAGPGDAVVAADWQPTLFPHSLAWSYYAARLAHGRPVPPLSPFRDDFLLLEPEDLAARPRVFCCLRSLPAQTKILKTLRAAFPAEDSRAFGRSVHVHVFTRP